MLSVAGQVDEKRVVTGKAALGSFFFFCLRRKEMVVNLLSFVHCLWMLVWKVRVCLRVKLIYPLFGKKVC